MRFNVLSDSDSQAKLDEVLYLLSDLGYRQHFQNIDYGTGLNGVTVVFVCQDPRLDLKRRVRLVRMERKLYLDIMLNLAVMKAANQQERSKS